MSSDNVLRAFILDYCNKSGLHSAAAALRSEVQRKGESDIDLPPRVVDRQSSLLSEWYVG